MACDTSRGGEEDVGAFEMGAEVMEVKFCWPKDDRRVSAGL